MAKFSEHEFRHWEQSRMQRSDRAANRDRIGLAAVVIVVSCFVAWVLLSEGEAPTGIGVAVLLVGVVGALVALKLLDVWYRAAVNARRISEDLREDKALAADLEEAVLQRRKAIRSSVDHDSYLGS